MRKRIYSDATAFQLESGFTIKATRGDGNLYPRKTQSVNELDGTSNRRKVAGK
jgi:hypothetical protein